MYPLNMSYFKLLSIFSRDNYTANENKYSVGRIEILSPAVKYNTLIDLLKDSNSNSMTSVTKPLPLQGLYYFTLLFDLKD